MKLTLVFLALAAAAAIAYADPKGHDYGYGYNDKDTRVYNAKRQLYVNNIARKVGAGVGTADKDGVPGTYFSRDSGYNYGYYGYPTHKGGYYGYPAPKGGYYGGPYFGY